MLDIATSATARYTVERVTYNTVDWAEAESTRVQANSAWSAKSRYRPPPLIRCPLVFSIGRLAIAIDPQHRAVHVQNPVRRIVNTPLEQALNQLPDVRVTPTLRADQPRESVPDQSGCPGLRR